jgi:hypothetical protein
LDARRLDLSHLRPRISNGAAEIIGLDPNAGSSLNDLDLAAGAGSPGTIAAGSRTNLKLKQPFGLQRSPSKGIV